MADFRKGLLLAAAALTLSSLASAQTYSCVGTTGAPPTLRSEGVTENTGSIVITCQNVPTATTVNIDLQLNNGSVPITSRSTEAAVQVNGGAPLYGSAIPLGSAGFNNTVRFTGITIPAGATSTVTISGVRANVNPAYVPIGAGGFGLVNAVVSISNGSLPLQGNVFPVGIVQIGFAGLKTGPTVGNINVCAGASAITVGTGNSATITWAENFPTAFKVQNPASTASPDSESGSNPLAGQAATSGTQFAVTINSIPSGVTLYVPLTITSTNASGTGTAVLVASEGSTTPVATSASGAQNLGGSVGYVVPVTSGTTVFYNVTSVDPSSIDTFTLNVYPATSAAVTSAQLTSPTLTVTYAPRNASASAAVPRFNPPSGSGSGAGVKLFNTTGCQTTILFPYLTNQAGFDSGISIAGTATGMFGDPQQGGTCTLNMFGANAPTTAPTLTVPSAGEGHTTISSVAPNFQGFVVATCNFNYAHAYAFITDGFMGPGKGLSEGYVALVLNRGTSTTLVESLSH